MRLALLVVVVLVPLSVGAEPGNMSQHPRAGLLAEIEFHENSARMGDAAGSQLGHVAAWAEDNFDGLIVVDGHADARGPAKNNVALSMRRARLVRDQLIAIGVDPTQIVISAFGAETRRHARVRVWGTHNTLESVIAGRRNAKEVLVNDDRVLELQQRQARPSPMRTRRSHTCCPP